MRRTITFISSWISTLMASNSLAIVSSLLKYCCMMSIRFIYDMEKFLGQKNLVGKSFVNILFLKNLPNPMCSGVFSNNNELTVKQALNHEVSSFVFLLGVVCSGSNFIVVRLHFYHVDESPQFLRLQESLHLEPSQHVILTFKFCDEWAHNV